MNKSYKYIKYTSGALAFLIALTSLTGCQRRNNSANYNSNEGYYLSDENGEISYEKAANWYVIKVHNKCNDNSDIYIAKISQLRENDKDNYTVYTNVFNGEHIIAIDTDGNSKDKDFELLGIKLFEDYLISYNFVKNSYSYSDIERFLNVIREEDETRSSKPSLKVLKQSSNMQNMSI